MFQQRPYNGILHQLAQLAFFKTGTVFHCLLQHNARTGILVFQLLMHRFQFFYIRMFFQFGGHTVELFARFDLLDLWLAFFADLHVYFHTVYLFGSQVREQFFNQLRFHAPCQAGDVSVAGITCKVLQCDADGFLFAFLSLCTEFLAFFQELLQVLVTFQQFLVCFASQWDQSVTHQQILVPFGNDFLLYICRLYRAAGCIGKLAGTGVAVAA